jgi:hypothetical protein
MSLNIIIDADVSAASQKISTFSYEVKKSFGSINTVLEKTATGFQYNTNKIADSTKTFAKASTNSLTALSLTLQDLPFGFIGIQNNLPGIIKGLGDMSQEAKTGASVMSQLKGALVGPAGLYLAFSAITAIVTTLSMKYGGLGNAIDALFGKVNPLAKVIKDAAKSQEDLNESYKTSGQIIASATGSVESQIVKVQLLSDTVKNLSNSEELRKNALSELQKIDKAYFGQITTGTSDIVKLEEATRKYTDALLANAIAKAYEQKVTQGAINLEEQRNYLKDLAPAYAEATKRQKEFLKTFEDAYDPVTGAKIAQPGFIAVDPAIVAFNKQKLVVDAAITAQDKLKQSFSDATIEALKFVEPLEQGSKAAKDYKYEIDELIGALSFKTQIEDVKDLADVILDVNKKYASRATALKELQQLGDGVFNGLTLEKKGYNNLKDAIDTYILKLQTLDLEIKGRINANKLQEQADKNTAKAIEERIKAEEELFKQLLKQPDPFPMDFAKGFQKLEDWYKSLQEAKILLTSTFFQPLESAFMNLFETGKFGFKSFADAVLKQIQQLVSKIIATGIISLIANLMAPGAGLGASGIGAILKRVGADIFSAIGLGGKSVANPSFGGVGPGGLGMSGQVNVVLRGSDLVGALNRTNATINRVG